MTKDHDITLVISKKQAQEVLNIVAEFPAKSVMNAVDILRNLQPLVKESDKKK